MLPIPPLTDDESDRLRASIQQDGVMDPVLLARSGYVISGADTQRIASELGIKCPTKTLDVDDQTAERLAVTTVLARDTPRDLPTWRRAEAIAWLDARHQLGSVDATAARINEDLAILASTRSISGQRVYVARVWDKKTEDEKAAVRAGQLSFNKLIDPGSRERKPRSGAESNSGSAWSPSARARHSQGEPGESGSYPRSRCRAPACLDGQRSGRKAEPPTAAPT
jgi:hypothetical protein